jgi:hypothetical protein
MLDNAAGRGLTARPPKHAGHLIESVLILAQGKQHPYVT